MTNIPKLRVSPNSHVNAVITARREDGYDRQWVARDQDGCYYDHAIFLSDLMERVPNLRVTRDE